MSCQMCPHPLPPEAKHLLASLVEEGLVVREGAARATRYKLK